MYFIYFTKIARFTKEKNYTQVQNTEVMHAFIMDSSEYWVAYTDQFNPKA